MRKIAKIKIVNTTGVVTDTKVYTEDGETEITGITRIVIDPLEPEGLVKATLTIYSELDIVAESIE